MKSEISLLLASQSPRRRELLTQIGVRFDLISVDVPEVPAPGEAPVDYVRRLAEEKARSGARLRPGVAVLGADTLGVCKGEILEKPADEADAYRMLRLMSGACHTVYSAVSICRDDHQSTRLSATEVRFRSLTDREIARYWQTGEPRDKAGAYAIQGLGAVFVEKIEGSYSGVVGLPLRETRELLEEFGVPWWQADGEPGLS